ncbi:MAG: DUF1684 domain-containing protein [Lunatimonas sp.]|uniref:DUF1684 domain-containing protein n=1 Tax=Lunatimonas sp. TaxID=2060141 RepID=UPI00263BB5AE|nr:DUF1684 domain-containing protein [Lunatimonas sp.]MCC5935688.1 DUF1684 domain-containing protein [Lunatimonas sp.]
MDLYAISLNSPANRSVFLFALLFLVFGLSCTTQESRLQISDSEHEADMATWEDLRREALTAEDGWLNLIGLEWLTPGLNRMGSGEALEVPLPHEAFPSELGVFDWSAHQVFFEATVDGVQMDGQQVVGKVLVFDADTGLSPLMAFESLRWQLIQRGDRIGVRLRHLDSEVVRNFQGVDRFPRQIGWRKVGMFTPYEPHKLVPLANVLGQTLPTPALGTVDFEAEGKRFQLDAFEEGEELFLIFADESSGRSTYGGGRYLYAEKPDAEGRVILDFNKAINPPCVFTPFATCPLPPKQNIVELLIEAGEMATYQ